MLTSMSQTAHRLRDNCVNFLQADAVVASNHTLSSPVTLFEVVATASFNPAMRDPVISGTPRAPVSCHPDMPSADPIPVAAEPDIAGNRRRADHFHLWCRRSHRDDAVRRPRSDHAA